MPNLNAIIATYNMKNEIKNLIETLRKLGFNKEASELSDSFISKDVKQILLDMRENLAKIAQSVYDEWIQDEEGYSESHGDIGYGGICHIIADKIIDHIYSLGGDSKLEACSVSDSYVQHVYVVAWFGYKNPDYIPESENDEREEWESEEMIYDIFSIDIPYYVYEDGGGFTWKKIDNVQFTAGDVVIDVIEHGAYQSRLDEITGAEF